MGTLSIWHWMIVLLVVILVFGTGKLRNLGKDLGGAIKGFKEGLKEGTDSPAAPAAPQVEDAAHAAARTVDVSAREKTGG